jgi:hypothetical protein
LGGAAGARASEQVSVLVQRAGKLQHVAVTVGLVTATQAAVTPVSGSTLSAGDAVVTALSGGSSHAGTHKAAASSNPLAGGGGPHMGRIP